MQDELIDEMARAEGAHWYFTSRRRVLGAMIESLGPRGPVLDVGCGTGGNERLLRPYAPLLGVDYSHSAAKRCLQLGYSAAAIADGHRLPFADGAFPTVGCFDVLEHLNDDRTAIAELARVCQPGGLVLASVPAFRWLWSAHDVALGHRRRYTRGQVEMLFTSAGLRLRRLTYCLLGTFMPVAVARSAQRALRLGRPVPSERARTDVDGFPLPAPLNNLLGSVLAQEARWVRRRDLPVGLSIFAAGEKP
ncbi:MAG: class I SAM-dependent methyltransferase [Myxococcales bacterium]